ncbi:MULTISPECIES: BLUF domain-containing protein [Stenotrophomonas]|uniref:BLUF domain-containing protein n=1 Tax=Stenotrophomonas maltophilia TaxID=40324 RepID=A0AA40Y4X9_STEMA|nr:MULTISPECIES: BLUF domain-containing protein [Stenotrophomonas]AWB78142.1 F420H(2):quinone oxidoreductase [Stenotrophomonas maltophilia]KOO76545.1 F420H2:quinone oxidoreductase [Stenotrophomonas maltophilia]MBH1585633.1 BLUF domain-containing protein [Stenotrophomonas maltophilia]MBH1714759.1 BLUF domain-containing protein [Stenotrophomonas maltophilia]MBH1789166.1 BLUF domain-containing protein [Stenotrophomonas maltophilia]
MLHAFAYSSRMSAGLSNQALHQIVSQSATFNRRVDVTGALIVDGQRFFQYIEGPPDALEAVKRRIHDSRSHAAVVPVLDMAISARAVPYWAMTHIETGQIVVSGLVNARWDEFGHSIPGMDQLVRLLRPHFPRVGTVGAPRAAA